MGIYTQFVLNIDLKESTPKVIRDILDVFMLNQRPGNIPEDQLTHDLFKDDNWVGRFTLHVPSFQGTHTASLTKRRWQTNYVFNLRCDFANYNEYTNNYIDTFLDWLHPYIKTRGFAGYYITEDETHPLLIYIKTHDVVYRQVNLGEEYVPSRR